MLDFFLSLNLFISSTQQVEKYLNCSLLCDILNVFNLHELGWKLGNNRDLGKDSVGVMLKHTHTHRLVMRHFYMLMFPEIRIYKRAISSSLPCLVFHLSSASWIYSSSKNLQ